MNLEWEFPCVSFIGKRVQTLSDRMEYIIFKTYFSNTRKTQRYIQNDLQEICFHRCINEKTYDVLQDHYMGHQLEQMYKRRRASKTLTRFFHSLKYKENDMISCVFFKGGDQQKISKCIMRRKLFIHHSKKHKYMIMPNESYLNFDVLLTINPITLILMNLCLNIDLIRMLYKCPRKDTYVHGIMFTYSTLANIYLFRYIFKKIYKE